MSKVVVKESKLLASNISGFCQTHTVTIGTAVALMAYYSLKISEHIVAFSGNKREVSFSGKGLHSLKTTLVFCERVDVGIVPESSDLMPLILKRLHHISRARATAGVE